MHSQQDANPPGDVTTNGIHHQDVDTPSNANGDAHPVDPSLPPNANHPNRYIKGRLPEGVDFAAYPGRSSTPLPTAESKSAERINQLKIWNEAATNDDKRRLPASIGNNPGLGIVGSATRRHDSFKEAKDRHSSSFQDGPPPGQHATAADVNFQNQLHPIQGSGRTGVASTTLPSKRDMFADRSDSDDSDDDENHPDNLNVVRGTSEENVRGVTEERNNVDQVEPAIANGVAPPASTAPSTRAELVKGPAEPHPAPQNNATTTRQPPVSAAPASPSSPPAKESGRCCTIM